MNIFCTKIFALKYCDRNILFEMSTDTCLYKVHVYSETLQSFEETDTVFIRSIKHSEISNNVAIPYLKKLSHHYCQSDLIVSTVRTIYCIDTARPLYFDFSKESNRIAIGSSTFVLPKLVILDAIEEGQLGYKYATQFLLNYLHEQVIGKDTEIGNSFAKYIGGLECRSI